MLDIHWQLSGRLKNSFQHLHQGDGREGKLQGSQQKGIMWFNVAFVLDHGGSYCSITLPAFICPLQGVAPEHVPIVANEYLKDISDPVQLRDKLLELLGDVVFVAPAILTAKLHRGQFAVRVAASQVALTGPVEVN